MLNQFSRTELLFGKEAMETLANKRVAEREKKTSTEEEKNEKGRRPAYTEHNYPALC